MKSKHWLAVFFVLLFAGMGGYMAINYIVDPLGYFTVEKESEYYDPNQYVRAIKAKYVAANDEQIDAVVIGGSKAGALNTELLTQYTGKNYYNYYFNVGNFSDYLAYIEYLVNNSYVSEITLHLSSFEVDYFQASSSTTTKVPAIVSGSTFDEFKETLSFLLTDVSTLKKNYKKIQKWDTTTLDETAVGEKNRTSLYRKFAADPVGYTEKNVTKGLNNYLKKMFAEKATTRPAYDANLTALRSIKKLCDANGVTLKVMIGASFIGERDTYECNRYYAYLKELVSITDVWDFSSFSDINLNPYNFVNRKHYNTAVGDLMINTMYGGESVEGFGIYLTKDNIDDYLKQRKADFDELKLEFETTGTIVLPDMTDDSYIAAVDVTAMEDAALSDITDVLDEDSEDAAEASDDIDEEEEEELSEKDAAEE